MVKTPIVVPSSRAAAESDRGVTCGNVGKRRATGAMSNDGDQQSVDDICMRVSRCNKYRLMHGCFHIGFHIRPDISYICPFA
jgi:hypothetical protein